MKPEIKCKNCGCGLYRYMVTKTRLHPNGGRGYRHKRENELGYCPYHGCDKPEPKPLIIRNKTDRNVKDKSDRTNKRTLRGRD